MTLSPQRHAQKRMADAPQTVPLRAHELTAGHRGTPTFHDVNISIEPGRIHGIIGPNGAGKSTLLNALALTLPSTRGSVVVGDDELASLTARKRAHVRSLVPQGISVDTAFTVRALVRLGRYAQRSTFGAWTAHDDDAVDGALNETGLADLAHRPVTELSGGQQQRALIAKALAQRASFLLLDEPLSALDPLHQLQILAILRRCSENGTGIALVLHDLTLAGRVCDTISVLAHGRIHATGSPQQVLTPELLRDVYGVIARVRTDPDTDSPAITLISSIGES